MLWLFLILTIMARNHFEKLTEEHKLEIEKQLFGPYKTAWYNKDGVVLNGDDDIAKRLGLEMFVVATYTGRLCKEKLDRFNMELEIADCKACTKSEMGCKLHKHYFKTLKQ